MTKTNSWWRSKRYWKVCEELDPSKCSNNIWIIRMSDHNMNKYEEEIMSPPTIFYDKRDRKFSRWGDALANSCNGSK